MAAAILRVESIQPEHFGQTVTVVGMLLLDDFKCWLAPINSSRRMQSIRKGVRILLPGLGSEAFESPLAIVTNGRIWVSVETAEITGRLVAPQESEGVAQLLDVSSVTFKAGEAAQSIQLDGIRELSDWQMQGVNQAPTPEYREGLLRKYVQQRSQ